MKIRFPFFDYAWFKLWVLLLVAIQAAETVSFFERAIIPQVKTFGEKNFEANKLRCAAKPWRCVK